MKILFLDFDGVLVPLKSNTERKSFFGKPAYMFDQEAVTILNNIVEQTNCEIVVSSDWKLHWTLIELREIFKLNGISKEIFAVTDNLSVFNSSNRVLLRATEIAAYVTVNDIKNYCAVDDLDLTFYLKSNFVLCENAAYEGLKENSLKEKIIKCLI